MLYVGLDVSRKRIDFHALWPEGELAERGAVAADRDGLARLVLRLGGYDREVVAVVDRSCAVADSWEARQRLGLCTGARTRAPDWVACRSATVVRVRLVILDRAWRDSCLNDRGAHGRV